MKRKLLIAAGVLCMMISFPSCEDDCKICQQNKYEDSSGDLLQEGAETEYCGASLLRIETTPDVHLLGTTTKWECR